LKHAGKRNAGKRGKKRVGASLLFLVESRIGGNRKKTPEVLKTVSHQIPTPSKITKREQEGGGGGMFVKGAPSMSKSGGFKAHQARRK